ncbi:hypothetical protein QR680_000938 [Steinernema hermaphroditum]|uniref:Uncharacterized protein n=1 Tax=Steinernema hermaphroditum TaxID=289476 RepID=A0AA39GXZ7_9BILA|nr:hypothetical protein QR680_000938 [Steinernema hermaphroditum]
MEPNEATISDQFNAHEKLSKLEVIEEDRVLETSSTVPPTSVTFESIKDACGGGCSSSSRCSTGVTFPDASFSTAPPLATTTATIVPTVVRNQLVVNENGKTQLNSSAHFINVIAFLSFDQNCDKPPLCEHNKASLLAGMRRRRSGRRLIADSDIARRSAFKKAVEIFRDILAR